ncbi:MAG TPA: hypothetical protein VFA55_05620 [Candidatus Kapabacteria bacterium]|nr:hypothetical protein [Candidatus Kapabacteria bacterium]
MKHTIAVIFIIVLAGMAQAQNQTVADTTKHVVATPLVPPPVQNQTTISFGAGSTIFPTTIVATQRLGDGGGGIIGGNVTVNLKVTQDISPRWRIPVSLSLAFLRGNESFFHAEVVAVGDTEFRNYLLTNSVNMLNAQVGIEYYHPYQYVTPYGGADIMLTSLSQSTLDFTIQQTGQQIASPQSLPALTRWGAMLRAGAEFPLPQDGLYFDASVELGALNLLGRGNDYQLLTPTQLSFDDAKARVASGLTGEAVATFFRLLVKVAWKFNR